MLISQSSVLLEPLHQQRDGGPSCPRYDNAAHYSKPTDGQVADVTYVLSLAKRHAASFCMGVKRGCAVMWIALIDIM
jgi:hypothetical protein